MSEKFKPNLEQLKPIEHRTEHAGNQQERELTRAEKEHGKQEHVESASAQAEQHAISGKELTPAEREHSHGHHPVLINKQLKDMAFDRTLTRTRKKLSAPSKAFSKVIHNPTVDRTSELVGRTVARPSSMLGGALFACIGSSSFLWIARKYGYEYNYLIMLMMFVGGMVIGTAIELAIRALRRER